MIWPKYDVANIWEALLLFALHVCIRRFHGRTWTGWQCCCCSPRRCSRPSYSMDTTTSTTACISDGSTTTRCSGDRQCPYRPATFVLDLRLFSRMCVHNRHLCVCTSLVTVLLGLWANRNYNRCGWFAWVVCRLKAQTNLGLQFWCGCWRFLIGFAKALFFALHVSALLLNMV